MREGVRAGTRHLLGLGRLERGRPRSRGFVRSKPVARRFGRVAVEHGGHRRVHAPTLVREQVRGKRRGDELMTDPERPRRGAGCRLGGRHGEPLPKRLLEARCQITVEHPRAASQAVRGVARRRSLALLVRGRHRGELIERERALRERQRAQDAAAVRRSVGDPAEDELCQRGRERGAGELSPRVEHLLDDERVPARPLGHEQEERGGWPLALVNLDQRADLRLAQRADLDPVHAAWSVLDGLERRPKRVRAGKGVVLVRPDEEKRKVPGGPAEERHQVARRGVDLVQVLEEEDDRAFGGKPCEQSPQCLEGPLLSAFSATRCRGVDRGHPRDTSEEGTEELGSGRDEIGHARPRQRAQVALDREPDGSIGGAAPRGKPVAAKERNRAAGFRGDPRLQLVKEPACAHPARAGDEDGAAAPVGHVRDGPVELVQLVQAPDEPSRLALLRHSRHSTDRRAAEAQTVVLDRREGRGSGQARARASR